MKKILHITSQYPGKTGSGVYLNALIKEARKKGYDGALIAGISKFDKCIDLEISKENFYPVLFETKNLPFPVVGMSDVMPYESTRYCDLNKEMFFKWKKEFETAILKAVNKFKPDIIISHHLWILTSLVKRIVPDIKTIALCHGTDIRQFKKCPRYREYVLNGCRKLDLVLALNNNQKKIINDIYSIPMERIVTIGGGYNNDIFYPDTRKVVRNTIRLVYAGKISNAKGVLSLIRAYNMLNVNEYEVELLVVGSGVGKEKERIKEAARNSKFNIKFIEEVPQERLAEIFRISHIFVLPSFYEGLSLVTLEALASGLMVVATEIEGLKEFLGKEINNSGIIEYVELPLMETIDKPFKSDLPHFESRLKKAIEKQALRIKEGFIIDKNVKNKIDNMSWENIFQKIEKIF